MYHIAGSVSAQVAGKTVHLFTFGPTDVTLSTIPDAIAAMEVGSGIAAAGKAVFAGTGEAETLDLTLTDNVPGLPSDLIDTISLKGIPMILAEGVVLAEHVGLELDAQVTITKVAV